MDETPRIGDLLVRIDGFDRPENVAWDMIDLTQFPKWEYKGDGWEQVDKGNPAGIKKLQAHWHSFEVLHPNALDVFRRLREERRREENERDEP